MKYRVNFNAKILLFFLLEIHRPLKLISHALAVCQCKAHSHTMFMCGWLASCCTLSVHSTVGQDCSTKKKKKL